MDISKYYAIEGENPLDEIKPHGGLTAIFRTIGCIGDSLSSGEHESCDEEGKVGYNDYYEYSWGQYIARAIGAKVYNFSRGGMTAKEYCDSFADNNDFWNPDLACQAYIMALGLNDICNTSIEVGTIDDIDLTNPENNKPTFAGYYGKIIQKYREISPKCRFFLMTIPRAGGDTAEWTAKVEKFAELIHQIAGLFEFTYVLDLFKYAPVYDDVFKKNFYLAGHMNAAGYLFTAQMTMTYIDYIIRNHPEDFAQVGFIGKGGVHNIHAKW
ncbi:MAG: SGNH/GDSL hydrolase family protein [Ruminococcaceae bacterium]|nr:SGNH/GDSL hydrolase family protein [Oscillospiraceae bacterium]